MKTYVIFCIKAFDCEVEGKKYHPIRAMIGEIQKIGSVNKVVNIKLIKCGNDFKSEINKPCNIFFDENGRAQTVKYIED